ncbi:type II toxin-antitoxin system RelE/ParE family toxin [Aequorivita capsosiphonis]|uniref:type II toxin-antitoxin system RelE/ParE family toxin n=1 Tax=Aequorivita capsosiphonis TaxID=487317 RepID=UPI00041F577D|nr:type II toxin-antitoxin system RelE/ParE family toxin [Aequorivita capsosiphonis]
MEILFTKRAYKNYNSIKDHISSKFGPLVTEAFENKMFDFLELLKNFPELGSLEVAEKGIRGFQFSKQTRIFYRIKENKIIILTLFDVRQHPDKKKI